MKILFSPSEAKTQLLSEPCIGKQSFIFPSLYPKRLEVLRIYDAYCQKASLPELEKLFGIKDARKIEELLMLPLEKAFTCKAIERYSGVAYEHLSYSTLEKNSQHWIDENVMIFSNLFGPLLAKDLIPHYKLQQGEALGPFKPEVFYKAQGSASIDAWLKDDAVLDLRAGFYEKFYTLRQPYNTMKFLKKGKVVSHFAKAYRGNVLRQLALFKPKSEEAFTQIAFENLRIVEIKQSALKREYVYEIID